MKQSADPRVDVFDEVTILVGQKIRSIRKDKGITADVLAKKTGLSKGYISKVENGHQSPTLLTLSKLARALDVPVVAFFTFL